MISSQKLVGNLDKMTVANLGRQRQRSLDYCFERSCKYLYLLEVISYFLVPSIVLKLDVYIHLSSYYKCFCIPSLIRQLYAICHINEKATPQ